MPLPWNNHWILLTGITTLFVSCCKPPPEPVEEDLLPVSIEVPAHFRDIVPPEDNEITPAKIALGKKLFYDPILSVDSTVSCASCHLAANAFSDPNRFSVGYDGRTGTRQAMAIMNLAYAKHLFWDGRSPTLEAQVLDPVLNPLEMANDSATVAERLNRHPYYSAEIRRHGAFHPRGKSHCDV